MMTQEELWKYFWDKKVAYARHYCRDFLWISIEDFKSVEKYFSREFNLFHPRGISLRSRRYFLHIHALYQGNYVFVHKDTGNVVKFLPLGIIHLFFDVIPWLIFVLIKRKTISIKDFYKHPK